VVFKRDSQLVNYSGTRFDFRIDRTVRLLERAAAAKALGAALPAGLKVVAFESHNVVANTGKTAWTKSGGMLSIWILGMFQPTRATTVVIPYRQGSEAELGPAVNDAYFGKVKADRLLAKDGLIFFKGDGEQRGKIGLSPKRAKGLAASYDASRGVLTFVRYDPAGGAATTSTRCGRSRRSRSRATSSTATTTARLRPARSRSARSTSSRPPRRPRRSLPARASRTSTDVPRPG
jgi:hypothetical protein